MNRLRQVSVNHVEASEAPASISTRISFSIPRMESANLGRQWEEVGVSKRGKSIHAAESETHPDEQRTLFADVREDSCLANKRAKPPRTTQPAAEQSRADIAAPAAPASPGDACHRLLPETRVAAERAGIISIIRLVFKAFFFKTPLCAHACLYASRRYCPSLKIHRVKF